MVRQVDLAAVGAHLTRFEEVDRLSQHFPEVAAVDLVDDEDEWTVAGLGSCIQKPPWARCEAKAFIRWVR